MGPFQIDKPLTDAEFADLQGRASGSPDDAGYVRDAAGNILYNTKQPVYDESTPVGLFSKSFGALTGQDTPNEKRANTSWWDAAKNTVKPFLPYANDRDSVVPDAVAGLAAPFELNHRGVTEGPDSLSAQEKAMMIMSIAGIGGAAAGLAKGDSMLLGKAGKKLGLTDPHLTKTPPAASAVASEAASEPAPPSWASYPNEDGFGMSFNNRAIGELADRDLPALQQGAQDFMGLSRSQGATLHANGDDTASPFLMAGAREAESANGEAQPMRAYHGTPTAWEGQFDPSKSRANVMAQPRPYFADNPDEASGYAMARNDTLDRNSGVETTAPAVMAADISLKKPFNNGYFGENGPNIIPPDEYQKITGIPQSDMKRTGHHLVDELFSQEAHKLLPPEVQAMRDGPAAGPGEKGYWSHAYDPEIAPQVWEGIYGRMQEHGYDGFVDPNTPSDYGSGKYKKIVPFARDTVKSATSGETLFSGGDEKMAALAPFLQSMSPEAYERASAQGFNLDQPLHHATTHDLGGAFRDPKDPANQSRYDAPGYSRGSYHGPGIYMTSSIDDASRNYLADGPDLKLRVGEAAERLENDGLSRADAMDAARNEMIGGDPEIHDLIARPEKILDVNTPGKRILGGFGPPRHQKAPKGKDTLFDYDSGYNPDTDEFGDPTGSGIELLSALERRLRDSDASDNEVGNVLGGIESEMMDGGGMSASRFESLLRGSDHLYDAFNDDMPISNIAELIQNTYRDLGYDAIRHNNADQTFSGMRMPEGTSHTTMWDPEKIRRLDAQFDPNRRHENGLYYANSDPLAPFLMALEDEEMQQ